MTLKKSSDTGTLPLRPAKKQRVSSVETALPIHGTNLDTPLRTGNNTTTTNSNYSRWVTPSIREQKQVGEIDTPCTESGSSTDLSPPLSMKENGMASSKKSIQQDKLDKISQQAHKENLSNRNLAPLGSAKEKTRQELKAILVRNGQSVTGSVKVLQIRVADGETRGKLGLCPRCNGGKLKISTEHSESVYCSRKTHCGFQCSARNAPRAGPWTCVSFDDDEDATSPADAAPTRTTNTRPYWDDNRRPSSPPLQYWNGQQYTGVHGILSSLHTMPHGFGYPFFYPAHLSFPHHQNRQPFYPLHTAYPPLSPPPPPPPPQNLEPPTNYQTPQRTPPNSDGVQQNREHMDPAKRWFPLPNPAHFPDRGAAPLQRLPVLNEATAKKYESHKTNQSVCNYTPEEVAMATEAAKNILEAKQAESNKQQWSAEEDEIVRDAVTSARSHHFNGWKSLVPFLSGRNGKQIRDRWVNHLNPLLLHTPFDKKEDLKLWKAVDKFGTSWKEISVRHFCSKRSENAVKNRWHSAPFQRFIAETFGPQAYERAVRKLKKGSRDC